MTSVLTEEDSRALKSLYSGAGESIDADQLRDRIEQAQNLVYSRLNYAILNAIPHEHAAVMAVFGESKKIPSREHVIGSIEYFELQSQSGMKKYIAFSGITGQGVAQTAAAAAQIKYKCRHVQKILLVGIAAGQPNFEDKEADVRLGDIVIGKKIIQYDHVKRSNGAIILRGDSLPPADGELLMYVDRLRAYLDLRGEAYRPAPWEKYIEAGTAGVRSARRPAPDLDPAKPKRAYKKGLEQDRDEQKPYVHVGTIGSANMLLKDDAYRDELNAKYGTIAYEMEGAGLAIAAGASGMGYIVIRGICDYADQDKNNDWQTYASVCAASFARALIDE